MSRFMTALRLDVLTQQRYNLFYGAAFAALVWIVALRALPRDLLPVAVPLVVFFDLAVVGFYFLAAAVLFEKGEETLCALIVTPLRFSEYIAAKLVSLSMLAVLMSLVVIVTTYGFGFDWLLVLLGVALMSCISLLLGFISVAPFRSFTNFLIPSQLPAIILYIPLLDAFGVLHHPLFYLLPSYGPLLLIQGAFDHIATWQIGYAVVAGTLWIVALAWLAQRMFDRYIVARQGGR